MRIVLYTDNFGLRHRAAVPDGTPDEQAKYGLRMDPPDLGQLDWDGVRIDIHNALVELGVSNWRDWQQQQAAVQGAILRPVMRRLVALLRSMEAPAEEVQNDGS